MYPDSPPMPPLSNPSTKPVLRELEGLRMTGKGKEGVGY